MPGRKAASSAGTSLKYFGWASFGSCQIPLARCYDWIESQNAVIIGETSRFLRRVQKPT